MYYVVAAVVVGLIPKYRITARQIRKLGLEAAVVLLASFGCIVPLIPERPCQI